MKISPKDNQGDRHNVFSERAEELEKFKSQIRKKRFVSIVAPQHVGKSTILYNGLIPSLRNKGYMAKAGTSWKIASFVPEDSPMMEMAYSLTRANILYDSSNRITPKFEEEVLNTLNASYDGLLHIYKKYDYVHGHNLIVIVDQFELIFSPTVSVQERDIFIRLLLNATEQEDFAIYIVIAIDAEKYELGVAQARNFLDIEAEQSPGADIERMQMTLDMLEDRVASNTFQLHTLNQRLLEAAIKEYALKAGGVIMEEGKVIKLVERLYTVQYQLEQIPKVLGEKSWSYWGKRSGKLKINAAADTGRSGRKLELPDTDSFELGEQTEIVAQAEKIWESLDFFQRKTLEAVFKTVLFKNAEGEVIQRPTELETVTEIIPFANYEEIRKVLRIAINTKPLGLFSTRRDELEPDSKLKVSDEGVKNWHRLNAWLNNESHLVKYIMSASDDGSTYFYNKSVSLWDRPKANAVLAAITEQEINDKWLLQYIHNPDECLPFLRESEVNGPRKGNEPPPVFETTATSDSKEETAKTAEKPKTKAAPRKLKIGGAKKTEKPADKPVAKTAKEKDVKEKPAAKKAEKQKPKAEEPKKPVVEKEEVLAGKTEEPKAKEAPEKPEKPAATNKEAKAGRQKISIKIKKKE